MVVGTEVTMMTRATHFETTAVFKKGPDDAVPFNEEVEDLLGRREGPVGGQEYVDVRRLYFTSVGRGQGLHQAAEAACFDKADPYRFPLQMRDSVIGILDII
jgi:hypothetical protein